MNLIKKYQNIFIIGGLLIGAFVVYSIFFTGGNDAALTAQDVDPSQSAVEQELISLLLELRSITLDTTIFSDTRFQSLEDFSQDIVAEPVGRTNPFAPLGE